MCSSQGQARRGIVSLIPMAAPKKNERRPICRHQRRHMNAIFPPPQQRGASIIRIIWETLSPHKSLRSMRLRKPLKTRASNKYKGTVFLFWHLLVEVDNKQPLSADPGYWGQSPQNTAALWPLSSTGWNLWIIASLSSAGRFLPRLLPVNLSPSVCVCVSVCVRGCTASFKPQCWQHLIRREKKSHFQPSKLSLANEIMFISNVLTVQSER